MNKQQVSPVSDKIFDAIEKFLRAPPEGTPVEILNIFNNLGAENGLLPGIFLQTVEQAPVAISITNYSAKILYVNAAFEQLTGYSRDDVIGKKESILSSSSTPKKVYQNLWETICSKNVWKGKLVNHHKKQHEYLAELTISPVLSSKGEISYFLGMHNDITEIHRLEQDLKYQKALTEAAINSAPMIVLMINVDGKVVMDNLAYKALQGDFRGIEPASLFVDTLQHEIGINFFENSKNNGEFTNIEVRLEPPNSSSSRWFSCSGVCVSRPDDTVENYFNDNNKSRYLLLMATEVTLQRQRTNDARLNMIRSNMAEQQMVQSTREAILASVYKLQVPFNVMRAALSMSVTDHNQAALQEILLSSLESSDQSMKSLLDSLPSPIIEQSSTVNMNAIIHEILKLSTEKMLASGVVIDWRPAPVVPIISAKANALRRLFKYLIDNAIEAVNESDRQDKEIRIDTKVNAQEILISIMDNGMGIPDEMRLKIFEPFFCGWKKTAEHSGMGLTMAQEVINDHAGSIRLDEGFFGGCRLFVQLPLNHSGEE